MEVKESVPEEKTASIQAAVDIMIAHTNPSKLFSLDGCPSLLPSGCDKVYLKTAEVQMVVVALSYVLFDQ